MTLTTEQQAHCSHWLERCCPLSFVLACEIALAAAVASASLMLWSNPNEHVDELYHVLAGRALLDNGSLYLDSESTQPYTRAWVYSYAVAGSMAVFGPTIFAARLVSMISGVITSAVMFGWVRARVGRLSAWVALVLFAFMPYTLNYEYMARFYMMQTCALMIMAVCAFELARPAIAWRWRIALGAIAIICAALAVHLQVTSIIPTGLALAWVVLSLLLCGVSDDDAQVRRRWRIAGGALVAAGVVLAAITFISPLGQSLWEMYRDVEVWAAHNRDNPSYYVRVYDELFELKVTGSLVISMWLIALPIVVLALVHRWQAALFSLVMFGGAFVLHSFGGMKAPRYVYYAVPFFAVLWAVGIAQLLFWLHALGLLVVDRVLAITLGEAPRLRNVAAVTGAVGL
ncbi:MAG: glycosyltransferase family 39 protein, partial [Rhodospirillales bacterium]|nr:glycosyltransferase family 39 protein [Rhodospirillales bacterium]